MVFESKPFPVQLIMMHRKGLIFLHGRAGYYALLKNY